MSVMLPNWATFCKLKIVQESSKNIILYWFNSTTQMGQFNHYAFFLKKYLIYQFYKLWHAKCCLFKYPLQGFGDCW